MEEFTREVLRLIKSIPKGRVMSYGQIAKCLGRPQSARQVVRILYSLGEKHELPWHRVLNSQGKIGERDEEMMVLQRDLLLAEKVSFVGGFQVDKKAFFDLELS